MRSASLPTLKYYCLFFPDRHLSYARDNRRTNPTCSSADWVPETQPLDHCHCGHYPAVLFLHRCDRIVVRLWRAAAERVGIDERGVNKRLKSPLQEPYFFEKPGSLLFTKQGLQFCQRQAGFGTGFGIQVESNEFIFIQDRLGAVGSNPKIERQVHV